MKNKTSNINQAQYRHPTILGPIFLVASENGLAGLYWNRQKVPMITNFDAAGAATAFIKKAAKEVDEYISGKRKHFTVKLDLQGTDFQKQVWNELQKIPYGVTSTYGEIAKRIQNKTAIRAVGAANGQNAFSIIIPCHRVISSSGNLTGYSGGLKIKEKLLQIEGLEII